MRLALGVVPLASVALILALVPAPAVSVGSTACAGTGLPPAWFVGVVHDASPPRADFVADLGHVGSFLTTLQASYCIPDDQKAVLAFDGTWQSGGVTYDKASRRNLLDTLEAFGPPANAADEATLFLFLASHGSVYGPAACPDGLQVGGSYALLADGPLLDCVLGQALGAHFDPDVRMAVFIDCSFCGGFSDSLTAASGTVPDGNVPDTSGAPAPGRIVVTACAMTTECFGSPQGGSLFRHMARVLDEPNAWADGLTAPGFPGVQGPNVPAHLGPVDGDLGVSELVFGAVWSAYTSADALAFQQQFRMKYGFATLGEDIVFRTG